MAAYEAKKPELEELGAVVIAATTDSCESTVDMVSETGLSFPVAYGVTEDALEAFDPWWTEDHHGRYAEPMEFLVLRGGTVFGSIYASGPVGRMGVEDVLVSIRGREGRRIEESQKGQSTK